MIIGFIKVCDEALDRGSNPVQHKGIRIDHPFNNIRGTFTQLHPARDIFPSDYGCNIISGMPIEEIGQLLGGN